MSRLREDPERARAERGGRLLHLCVEREKHGLNGSDDEGERHEQKREQELGPGEGHVDAQRTAGPVKGEQRQSGHGHNLAAHFFVSR